MYNLKYYHSYKLHQLRPKLEALSTYITSDNIVIGIFQGNRGSNPLLDFKVKILKPGLEERPITPIHNLWVVDLMMKINDYSVEVKEILEYYINFYDTCKVFKNQNERINYKLQTVDYIVKKYNHIEQSNTLSLEYVCIMLELFSINEKLNSNAAMYRNLLVKLYDFTIGNTDYITVLEASFPVRR